MAFGLAEFSSVITDEDPLGVRRSNHPIFMLTKSTEIISLQSTALHLALANHAQQARLGFG
jgi:hypothetical protein